MRSDQIRAMLMALPLLAACTGALAQDAEGDGPGVAVVLDVSNSMWGQIEGRPKIEIAREAVASLMNSWNPAVEVGLIAFGHRREGDCGDIEIVHPVGPPDPIRFVLGLGGLTPRGKTPIGAAIRQAADALRHRDRPATVILFSDGVETCGANVCAVAAALKGEGVGFTAHVVGFDVAADEAQLSCIAENTGGIFLSATDAPQLVQALETVRTVATEPERADLVTLKAVSQADGSVIREGIVWRVVSLKSESAVPITAGTAVPRLPLGAGEYFVEARKGDAVGRIQITVVEGEAATHSVPLPVAPVAAQPASRLGVVRETEENGSFGRADEIASTISLPGDGTSFGAAESIAVPGFVAGEADRASRWLHFEAPGQGRLTAAIEAVPAGADIALRLWNAEREPVTGWLEFPLGASSADLAHGGEYRIELRARGDGEGSYRIALDFAATDDGHEPNDSFGTASKITPGEIVAAILPAGDGDFYAFEAADQGRLTFDLAASPPSAPLAARVWTAGRDPLTGWIELAPGRPAHADLPRPGRYVVEVRSRDSGAASTEPYRLVLAVRETGDAGEPNDSFGRASPVDASGTVEAAIFPAGDRDFLVLSVDDQGELALTADGLTEGSDVRMRILTAEREPLTGWQELEAGSTVAADLPRAGRYTVEVAEGSGRIVSPERFTISFAFTPTDDAFEPNDRFGDAAPLALPAEIAAAILPQGDVDWIALDAPAHGALTVTLADRPEAVDPTFRVWNAEREPMTNWLDFTAGAATVELPEAGHYALEIRDAGGGRSPDPYRLTLSFETADIAAMEPIAGVGILEGTLFPRRDADWFALTTGEAGPLSVRLEAAPEALIPTVRLWSADRQALSGWAALVVNGVPTPAVVELPAAGRYLLEVRAQDGEISSTDRYRLAVDWPGSEAVAVAGETVGVSREPATGQDPSRDGTDRRELARDAEIPSTAAENVGTSASAAPSAPSVNTTPASPRQHAPAGNAEWTQWFDIDTPDGSGDWEPLQALVDAHGVCEEPLDIACETTDGQSWRDSGQTYTCDVRRGGICRNEQQASGSCFDYRVRFLCAAE